MTNDLPRCAVIGIGNADRGDDAAGLAVTRMLRGIVPVPGPDRGYKQQGERQHPSASDIAVIEHSGEATALVAEMDGADRLFLIDACVSGAPPGTIHRFDVSSEPMPALASAFSTHGFGVAEAVELARALGKLPRRAVVHAIEGVSFEPGAPLSPPVAAAVAEVVSRLHAEITGTELLDID